MFVAFSGSTVTVIVSVSPLSSVRLDLSTAIAVTGILTVTVIVSSTLPSSDLIVIVTSPSPLATILPSLFTSAIVGSLDSYVRP